MNKSNRLFESIIYGDHQGTYSVKNYNFNAALKEFTLTLLPYPENEYLIEALFEKVEDFNGAIDSNEGGLGQIIGIDNYKAGDKFKVVIACEGIEFIFLTGNQPKITKRKKDTDK